MSAGVDTVDRSLENLYATLRIDDVYTQSCATSSNNLNESKRQFQTSTPVKQDVVQEIPQEKKKRKRIRYKKKCKNKEDKDQSIEILEKSNRTLLSYKINFTIKAIKCQNFGYVFRKRNIECQYINFDYSTNFDKTYIFDSRDITKSLALNESSISIVDKTSDKHGIMNRSHKNHTNEMKNLQSPVSHGKRHKPKRNSFNASTSKENKKVVPYNEYYKFEDVEEQLKLGALCKGVLRINPKNPQMGYVSHEDRKCQDYIITSVVERNRALDGDVVVLEIKPETDWVDNQKSANVVYIYEKAHSRVAVGSLVVFYDKGRKLAALQPRDKRIPRIVINQTSLPPLYFKNPTKYEEILFMAKIVDWNNPKYAEGVITEQIGVKNDLQNESVAILKEYQLDVSPFPPSVAKFLPKSTKIPPGEFKYREDLRKECIFTIDPLTARDLDDAISCKCLPNGNLEIGVHIADVSFYLDENTQLDEIVSKKATTVYLVDNVYHMLPVELCTLCSLLPGKDCLAFSVFFETTEDGQILSHRFSRTIINSCCQLAYEHAQDMIDNTEVSPSNLPQIYNGYEANDLADIVKKLQKVSATLRENRFENGALRIDQTKILFRLDVKGEPTDFFTYENIEAHRLIEELMLLANITVARRTLKDYPRIAFLRCHEPPNPRLIKEVHDILEGVGIHINISSSGTIHSSLQTYFTTDYFGIARSIVLNHLFAKPMTRARYLCAALEDEYNHYALSVDTYTHFTSPIRRYADIMVHRLLSASLGYTPKPKWETDYVREIAAMCNKQKYNAKKAGEASSDVFLVHYIEKNQPFIEEAVVIDVRDHSFHVMVLRTGNVVRMYLNNLGEGVQYKVEKVGESEKKQHCRINILYANRKYQMIEIFQIVNVHLKRKGNTFSLEGHLIQPE